MKNLLWLILFFPGKIFSQSTCNTSHLPIVFVHGFMGSGDNWASQIQRFSSNGYCEDRMFVFDWNSFGSQKTEQLLDRFIDSVCLLTGSLKVDLAGHSAGGSVCCKFLSDNIRARKVAHYAHIGSFPMTKAAGFNGNPAMINIYSGDDRVLKNGSDIPGALNVRQSGTDHLQTATSAETFIALYRFFSGGDNPLIATIVPSKDHYKKLTLKGIILGENRPLRHDSVRAFAFDAMHGKRILNKKSTDGAYMDWTEFVDVGNLKFNFIQDAYSEFEIRPVAGRRLFYFFEPFVRDNNHVYLRTLPDAGLAAAMLGAIPNDDKQTALIIFTANNAVIAGRDTLAIDSIPLSTQLLTPASKTAIACFLYDDGDGISSGKTLKSMAAAPFMAGADVFIKAEANKTMRVYYNGRTMVLPKRKSSEGIMIAMFN